MLKIAYPYQNRLNQSLQSVIFEDKYKFWNASDCWNYKINLDENSWDKIQMVSVGSDNNILGYFCAYIDRLTNKVSGISIINFGDSNILFSRDLFQFLSELFTKHKFRKIEWYVVVGNPAEKIYDKIVTRYGGCIVGIRKSTIIINGELKDEKEYEIFYNDYNTYINNERNKK